MTAHICGPALAFDPFEDEPTDEIVEELVYCVVMNVRLDMAAFATLNKADHFVYWCFSNILNNTATPAHVAEATEELVEPSRTRLRSLLNRVVTEAQLQLAALTEKGEDNG